MAGLGEIRAEYFREMLERGVREIYARQARAAGANIYSRGSDAEEGRSGALRDAFENPRYLLTPSGGGIELRGELPEYGRFVDMKGHGARDVYNRHVFGVLYRETLQDIRYEFRDWVTEHYGEELRELMKGG